MEKRVIFIITATAELNSQTIKYDKIDQTKIVKLLLDLI